MAGPKVACMIALDPEQFHQVASQALPGMDVVYGSTDIRLVQARLAILLIKGKLLMSAFWERGWRLALIWH